MAKTMKDFLNLYFRQLHFDSMPPAVRAQFDMFVNNNDLVGDMKSWRDELLDTKSVKTAGGQIETLYKDASGHYAHKPLPDAKVELSDDEWIKFYTTLQRAFAGMDMDRDSLDKKTKDFLDKYFGTGKVFEPMPLNDVAKNAVNEFRKQILDDDNGYSLFNAYAGVEDATKADYEEFKKSIINGDYEKKSDVRKKLTKMIRNLQSVDLTEYKGFQAIGEKLNKLAESGKLMTILNGLSQEKEPTTPDINKLKSRYAEILKTLHDEPKIAEDFKQFDNGKISGVMEAAIAKTDYTGEITKKDFVPEKLEDRKTLGQRIEGSVQDFYEDHLKRWTELRRGNVYVKDNDPAEPIIDVMTSKDINLKPTDGIQAMIDKADTISNKVRAKSPTAAEHFEWFIKTMKSLSGLNCFKKALINGEEQHTLIRSVWEKAYQDNKLEEVETTMEVLNIMSYGLLDSKLKNNLKSREKKGFVGDSSLSINKVPGVQPITNVIDKVGGLFFRTAGNIAIGAVNGLRRIGANTNEADEKKYLKGDTVIFKANAEDMKRIEEAQKKLDGMTDTNSREYKNTKEEIEKLQNNINKRNEKLSEEAKNLGIQNANDKEAIEKAKARQQGLDKDSKEYKEIQDEIDFYNSSIDGRTTDFYNQDEKKKRAYARMMAFWKLLKTGQTKYIFFRGTLNVKKDLEEHEGHYLDLVGLKRETSSRAA